MSEPVDGYAPLRIKRIVRETADAVSLVLDVPDHCSASFDYQAGQFLTLRVDLGGREFRRCYSMSSAPVEDELRITVKRDPGGLVSNWLNDTAAEGAELHVAPPEGRFVLRETSLMSWSPSRAGAASPRSSRSSERPWRVPRGACACSTPTGDGTR